ncbi:hypothetical protein C2845_PM03G10370 [Panicum miliaceum]|uniref:Uncharacterized protein n=1 Tax=Panicum miliaceum TaxID=4540 RepID=A0A3L6TEZ4_PANMI|nr:hypothetical protein C2845_PM03G10370 [Panicum miliaceum]
MNNKINNKRKFRSRPPVIVETAEDNISAVVGVGNEDGASVVVPVDVPDVHEVIDLAGYHRPSGLYRHCPILDGRRRRWPSGSSSAAADRDGCSGRLQFLND